MTANPYFLKPKHLLLSLSDKENITDVLSFLDPSLLFLTATQGTSQWIKKNMPFLKTRITPLDSITGSLEMLNGRVKTLHASLYASILADSHNPQHVEEIKRLKIPKIDLVIVNLYPFHMHLEDEDEKKVEWIDIGGVSLLRAASKNYHSVCVLSDPKDYGIFLAELKEKNGISLETRKTFAQKTFLRISEYDNLIARSFFTEKHSPSSQTPTYDSTSTDSTSTVLAAEPHSHTELDKYFKRSVYSPDDASSSSSYIPLRYGENPHQIALWTKFSTNSWTHRSGIGSANSNQTTFPFLSLTKNELSYNNILDIHKGLELLADLSPPSFIIIKHGNPCGVATTFLHAPPQSAHKLFLRAKKADPVSYYGGVVVTNCPIDEEVASVIQSSFFEVLIAPKYSSQALTLLSKRERLKILESLPQSLHQPIDVRSALGGYLIQTRNLLPTTDRSLWEKSEDLILLNLSEYEKILFDLEFAWSVVKHVSSNAIVIAKEGVTLGIGGGQTSRIDSLLSALEKGSRSGKLHESVLASDGFFPFRDSIDEMAKYKIRAVIYPGGSKNDPEVEKAMREHNIYSIKTHERHFKH